MAGPNEMTPDPQHLANIKNRTAAYQSFRLNLAEALNSVCAYQKVEFPELARILKMPLSSLFYLINQSDMRISSLIGLCFTLNISVTMTFTDEPDPSKITSSRTNTPRDEYNLEEQERAITDELTQEVNLTNYQPPSIQKEDE